MACTTLLVGKNASYDGSTMIARNDDSGSGHFTAKKFVVVQPEEHPAVYRSVLSHVEIPLPGDPMRMTAMPNAVEGKGIWAASGVNAANVGMTATETITSNPRVLGADPLVVYQPARGEQPEVPGGIGEEDIVYLVLPYIHSAREGVLRLGSLLEQYGTYEMNGIAFQDVNEIWWLETIGGHHWIARRVPDDVYVVMPNQLGLDSFDLTDALGEPFAIRVDAKATPAQKALLRPGQRLIRISRSIQSLPASLVCSNSRLDPVEVGQLAQALWILAQAHPGLTQRLIELLHVGIDPVAQVALAQLAPQQFGRVELGRIRRQV